MRTVLLAVLVTGCGAANQDPTFCRTHCGLNIAASNRKPQFPCEDYQAIEDAMLQDSAILPHSCEMWRGATAWEMPGFSTTITGVKAAGWAECWNDRFFFHTGDGLLAPGSPLPRRAWTTAFVHEALHLAQNCNAPLPIDPSMDEHHADWIRDDLMNMTYRVNVLLDAP